MHRHDVITHCDTSEALGAGDQIHQYKAMEILCPQFYLFLVYFDLQQDLDWIGIGSGY